MAMYPCLSLPSLSFPTVSGAVCSFESQYAGLPLKSHTVDIDSISGVSAINIGSDDKYAGFINFNQLAGLSGVNTLTSANVTFTKNNDNSYTISGTANGRVLTPNFVIDRSDTITGHKYLFYISESIAPLRLREQNRSLPFISASTVVACSEGKNAFFTFDSTVDISGTSFNVSNLYINIFDLTVMFEHNPSIADYIYSLEQQTAGSGVAYSHSLFPNDYYDYNAGTLTTVSAVNGSTNSFFTIPIGQTVNEATYNARTGVMEVTQPSVQTLQLPPCPIDTLSGVNNVFADTGDTTLQYIKIG